MRDWSRVIYHEGLEGYMKGMKKRKKELKTKKDRS
jgi:hypothetical protein